MERNTVFLLSYFLCHCSPQTTLLYVKTWVLSVAAFCLFFNFLCNYSKRTFQQHILGARALECVSRS